VALEKPVWQLLRLFAWVVTAMVASPLTSRAEPWIGPGDLALRHDLQQLADAGVLQAPTMSWPLPWADISADIAGTEVSGLSPHLQSALGRVRVLAATETASQEIGIAVEAAGTSDPWALRSFEDAPRDKGELTVTADQAGDRLSWKLSAGVVADPDDGQEVRLDGSYVGGQPDPVEQRATHAVGRARSQ
jgi:hypothetical protein